MLSQRKELDQLVFFKGALGVGVEGAQEKDIVNMCVSLEKAYHMDRFLKPYTLI